MRNAARTPPNVGTATIGRTILTALTRYSSAPALADDRQSWTYAQLADAMARIVAVMRSLGLKRGDALAMLVGNRVEQVAAQYAAVLMGVRYTALHPLASRETHAFVLTDAGINVLLVDPVYLEDRNLDFAVGCPALRHVLSLGPLEGAVDLLEEMQGAQPCALEDNGDPSDIAYVLYTGGTTGVPKGVMLPHRCFVTAAVVQAADWDLPDGTIRFLAATPTSHAAGAVVHTVLMLGGYIRLVSGFEPERFARIVADEQINLTFLVPTMLYVLMDHPASKEFDLSSMQTIVYGAAPMSPDRLRDGIARFGQVFVQLYGQTEAPMVVTTLRKADHDLSRPERLESCGLPGPTVDLKLFDSEMREVDDGEAGEICVRGSVVMEGYWKRDELTDEVFRGGWLHTGDVAKRSADGYLTIVDRTKDMIISGGFNVYPREVEDALMAHEAISSAAVIGVPDEKWGEAVTAYVVLRPGATTDEATLKAYVRVARGAIWTPKSIYFVEQVPLTALGKVDRKALRASVAAGSTP